MRRGFAAGLALGAAAAIALGIGVALLPTTPTWTFWAVKRALDTHDYDELRELIDFKSVAVHAARDMSDGDGTIDLSDLGRMARALLGGGKVLTIFNDPEHPVRISWQDFVVAWWNMEREGRTARVRFDAGGRQVTLLLGKADGARWRIVGLTPLRALLRVEPPPASGDAPAERSDAFDIPRNGPLPDLAWKRASSR